VPTFGCAASETHIETARLVSAAAGGDQRAWEDLIGRFSGVVLSVTQAHRLRPCDAADVSQTTWLRFLENVHKLRHPGRAGAWLATTARRECLRVLRRSGRELPTAEAIGLAVADDDAHPEDALLDGEHEELFWEAFGTLPQRSQDLLRLLMDESRSYEEISRLLDMPIGSIGPTRGRCLDQLRRKIDLLRLAQAA